MTEKLSVYLDDIESRLDSGAEETISDFWKRWSDHEAGADDMPSGRDPSPSSVVWPDININDALEDDDLMLIREFRGVSDRLSIGGSYPLRVRSNYGVANMATSFGAGLFVMPRETNTLPNAIGIGPDRCRELIGTKLPDMTAGNLGPVFRVGRRIREIFDSYPLIGKYVHAEQPDLQGPMDNLELLWGSEVFYALYDEPDTVHALLGMITDMISLAMNEWLKLFPENAGKANYFRHREKGCIAVRDDSAMNLQPEFYDEFIAPYDGRLLSEFGGIVHFCGRGDHFIDRLARLNGLNGINMSQPHLNDMEKVFSCTIDRGVHLSLSVDPFEVKNHDTSNLMFLSDRPKKRA